MKTKWTKLHEPVICNDFQISFYGPKQKIKDHAEKSAKKTRNTIAEWLSLFLLATFSL